MNNSFPIPVSFDVLDENVPGKPGVSRLPDNAEI